MQFKFEIMIKIAMTKNFKVNMNTIIVSISNLFHNTAMPRVI